MSSKFFQQPVHKSFFQLPDSSLFSEPSVWLLLAVNLIPLLGVFLWGWDLFSLMVLYWMETAMIGFYQLIKILVTQPLFAIFLIPFFTFHFGMFMTVHFIFISSFFGPPWVKALHDSVPAILNRLLWEDRFWIPALALFISHGVSFFLHGFKATPNPVFEALKSKLEDREAPMEVKKSAANTTLYHPTEDWQHTIDSTPAQSPISTVENTLSPAQRKVALAVTKSLGNNPDLMFEPYKRVIVMHITIIFGGILSQILGNSKVAFMVMIALKIAADLFSHANYHGLGDKSPSPENAFET